MSKLSTYPPLMIDETGTARIRGTRYKVSHLSSEHYEHGWTAEELLRQHPDLLPEQVYAALAYFYEHRDAFVAELKQDASNLREQNPTSLNRESLLKRSASSKS